jgi:hypothetical protein
MDRGVEEMTELVYTPQRVAASAVRFGCVYKIINTVTGKIYIGITRRTPEVRLAEHLAVSRWASKANDRRYLYNAMRRYPEECWTVETVVAGDSWGELCSMEIAAIAEHRANDREYGYNSTSGGEGCPGFVWTEDMRKRMSEARKGKRLAATTVQKLKDMWLDPAFRERALRGLRGYKQTAEQIEKRAAKVRGRTLSPEVRAKMSAASKGKPKSAQHIANSAAGLRGYKKTPEQIEKSARWHRGKKVSAETRAKMAAFQTSRQEKFRRGEEARHVDPRTNPARDAVIMAEYYRVGSFRLAAIPFGIKSNAAGVAAKRVRRRLLAVMQASSPMYANATIPAKVHPDWLEMTV